MPFGLPRVQPIYLSVPAVLRCRPLCRFYVKTLTLLAPTQSAGLTAYESGTMTTQRQRGGVLTVLIGRSSLVAALTMYMTLLTLSSPIFSFVNKW